MGKKRILKDFLQNSEKLGGNIEHLNTRILNTARVRIITFNQLDVVP